ncbi:tetratricopeptide repeat protein [Wenyingzhuangia sp. IMCC45574]
MKKIMSLLLLSCCLLGYSQDKKALLKELSEKACKCIDSIDTGNKTPFLVSSEVGNCIDKQTGAYQMGSQMQGVLDQLTESTDKKTKNIDVVINTNKESKTYKSAYQELEKYLFTNCPSVKAKIASRDMENRHSLSKNKKALKYYYKGMDKSKAGNQKKAIKYYKKALAIDSVFAFAWDNLGLSYRKLNQFDEAIFAYETSIRIDPKGRMPLQNIAVAYQYKKEYSKAVEAYKKLAVLDPDNPEIYYGVGNVYALRLNKLEEGLDNMCKAYIIYSQNKSPYRVDAEKVIGMIYKKMEKNNELDTFNKILKQNNINQK